MSRSALLWLSAMSLSVVLAAAACGGDSGVQGTPTTPTTASTEATATPTPVPLQNGDSGSLDALHAPDIVEELRPSVVHILSEAATLDVFGQTVPQSGVGTGVIIDEEGHIVTNNHVVVQPETCDSPARQITVTVDDGRQFTASIVGRDVPTDLAVLKIEGDGLTPAELGDSEALQVGDDVLAIGNALDLPGGPTVTRGVVSAKDRLIEESQCAVTIPNAIQTDASINPGNSGGPLLNAQAEVVGITTAIVGGAEGIGFAISMATAEPIIKELIDIGRVDRGFLGVTIVEITPSLAESFDLPVDHGVGVRSVQAGSPADVGGLQASDIIVGIEDVEITNSGELFQALTEFRAGDMVTMRFYRGGSLESAEVTLG